MVQVRRWNQAEGVLTFEALKALHEEGSFHLSRQEYPGGARFSGKARASTWYVLQGSCRLRVEGDYLLAVGDIADVPRANYTLEVGNEGVVVVQVWDLRPHMN
jgi:hypothetical protein